MTPEQLKELREIVGKAVGCDGPYRWGIEDYVAVAEHFYAQGQKDLAKELQRWVQEEWLSHEVRDDSMKRMTTWLRQKGLLE